MRESRPVRAEDEEGSCATSVKLSLNLTGFITQFEAYLEKDHGLVYYVPFVYMLPQLAVGALGSIKRSSASAFWHFSRCWTALSVFRNHVCECQNVFEEAETVAGSI